MNITDAAHFIKCSHCIGCNRRDYNIRCVVLKDMPDGRKKILVFGDRNWKHKDHLSQIRYVPAYRVTPI